MHSSRSPNRTRTVDSNFDALMARYRRRRIELGIDVPNAPAEALPLLQSIMQGAPGQHVPPTTESPLEHRMAELLIKMLDPSTKLIPQQEIRTDFGRFRMDFVLSTPDAYPIVAVECDGAQYHEGYRDEWRDAAILGSGGIDHIVRVRGSDLHRDRWDIAFVLATRFPSFFSERGRWLAAHHASQFVRDGLSDSSGHVAVWYPPERSSEDEPSEYRGFVHCSFIKISGIRAPSDQTWRKRLRRLKREPNLGIDGWARREQEAWAQYYNGK